MVPATFDKGVLPAAPQRNWKMMSMGRLRGSAVPSRRVSASASWRENVSGGPHDIQQRINEDRSHVNPFSASNITDYTIGVSSPSSCECIPISSKEGSDSRQRSQESRSNSISDNEQALSQCNDLCAAPKFCLDQEFDADVGSRCYGDEYLEQTIDADDDPLLPHRPVDRMIDIARLDALEESESIPIWRRWGRRDLGFLFILEMLLVIGVHLGALFKASRR